MSGVIPPLPHVFMGWHLIKHRNNFTLTYNVLKRNISRPNIKNMKRAENRAANHHNRNRQINALKEVGG
jgi:hypothetical protein